MKSTERANSHTTLREKAILIISNKQEKILHQFPNFKQNPSELKIMDGIHIL